jgi:energy-converting hydrogenase Eha subunit H
VKLLLIIGLLGMVGLMPFVVLRQRWAVSIWRRFKLVVVVYAIVILVAGIVRLVFNWEDIYG